MGGLGSGRKLADAVTAVATVKTPLAGTERVLGLARRLQKSFGKADANGVLVQAVARATGGGSALKRSVAWRRGAMVALTALGYTSQSIAELLGLEAGGVRKELFRLRSGGALDDADAELDHRLVPAAIEALGVIVDSPSNENHFEAVKAVLNGRGKLKPGGTVAAAAAPQMQQLNVTFTMPAGAGAPVMNGQIVGTGRVD